MNTNQLNASASSNPSANQPVPQLSRTNLLLDGENLRLVRDNPENQVIDPDFHRLGLEPSHAQNVIPDSKDDLIDFAKASLIAGSTLYESSSTEAKLQWWKQIASQMAKGTWINGVKQNYF